ncbi:mRNA splicing protein SYF1 [Spizellomyces punctatus DAOM BR117]|uniref:Pre-mRNA-splicing factor SYF1 n=1 Tax=Spizellomyces punctatus (strain DAOM BR117) TaxID=645134 RepID=A0A0L0HH24_SPIPD|nr:mRNA splicing protein SYF1 [Spizellomyces punctatus DAOM BR117]KND00377.1 hypothetical protein SPPG_04701 [Spizellomyces punctatus DAOM BR117]|eukprot:XP_016608416.1 hypothetical protein SPPG_04701 [Spizellomyces punctatus DAOM BR117]
MAPTAVDDAVVPMDVDKDHLESNGLDGEVVLQNAEKIKEEYLLLIREEDIPHEEECLRNPYTLKCWLRYIEHKKDAPMESRIFIYERAVKDLPGSYKLWKAYLDLRVSGLLEGPVNKETGLRKPIRDLRDREWERVNSCFERSLVLCNKFPVIWLTYCQFLMHQARPTQCRRTFDRALRALPITQHTRVWDLYLKFAKLVGGETAVRVWRRYIKLQPEQREEYVGLLLSLDPPRHMEAARVLASIVEDPKFTSGHGKSQYQLWTELCDLVTENPETEDPETRRDQRVERLDVDRIIRSGISRFSDQVGRLWNSLATWWMLQQEWEKARDVYEEAIRQVKTVRDFSMVFDAYAAMEETVLTRQMQELAQNGGADGPDDVDVDLRLARFEKLMERRPFLVNDVILRQNPHNVAEWEKRVDLWKERKNEKKIIETYHKAIETIHPKRAAGKLSLLWVHFAEFYEQKGDLDTARRTFEKAVTVPYKKADELADVWCQWAEMELRQENFDGALDVMGRATTPPRGGPAFHASIRYNDENREPQQRLFKSQKLWSFYVDLEESIGTMEGTRAVYDRIMELKIATPQIIINYAAFLEEHKWFEESYRVYERGIDLFGYPIAFDIWNIYLTKFIDRYGGTKLERARDLFEHAVDKVPPKFAKPLYLMYAKLEEDHGLARHAMRIYDRATRAVGDEDRYEMFTIYIAKATSYFGLTSTREIYERAIEALPDKQARDMSVRFSDMETRLGEVDRARAILAYGSQFCDPRMDAEFWKIWHDFEVKHGNEDTFKEMLRIKRSVQAKYNTEVNFISAQLLAARQQGQTEEPEAVPAPPTTMEELEAEARRIQAEEGEGQDQGARSQKNTRVVGFVRAKKTEPKVSAPPVEEPLAANPDEIEIGEDDSDEEEANMEQGAEVEGLAKRAIPEGVFGGLGADAAQADEKLGAKERFKRKR